MNEFQVCSNVEPSNFHKVNDGFCLFFNQRYDIIMCFLILAVFSGERCGPWASCLYIDPYANNLPGGKKTLWGQCAPLG